MLVTDGARIWSWVYLEIFFPVPPTPLAYQYIWASACSFLDRKMPL